LTDAAAIGDSTTYVALLLFRLVFTLLLDWDLFWAGTFWVLFLMAVDDEQVINWPGLLVLLPARAGVFDDVRLETCCTFEGLK
jgi:hypothetical protein